MTVTPSRRLNGRENIIVLRKSYPMIVDNQVCLHCGTCVGSCPTNSIFLHETFAVEFLHTCNDCGLCIVVCPVGSIRRNQESSAKNEDGMLQGKNHENN